MNEWCMIYGTSKGIWDICGTSKGIKSESNWCWRRQRRKEEWGTPAFSSKVEFVQESKMFTKIWNTELVHKFNRWCGLRNAAIFINSWIYSRKWNVDEKLKVKLLRKVCVGCEMLASSWKAWKCSALNLFKRIKAEYEKQSSEYELWEMLASSWKTWCDTLTLFKD